MLAMNIYIHQVCMNAHKHNPIQVTLPHYKSEFILLLFVVIEMLCLIFDVLIIFL